MEKSIHSAQYAVFLKVFQQTRLRAGLTQIDLAKRVGESQSFISKCELVVLGAVGAEAEALSCITARGGEAPNPYDLSRSSP